ncbi:hypothetical protein MSEO_20910 [Mycobacterium seoulense]|uniref:Uncharacterized protein n=1 Tax=Mycobacterium seoulense TaxID=386911 RepID=A0A7I7P0K4_9MYCO|nr:hypothetical protein MSEO_20910 [Mycobacterium seoulense]
MARVDPAVRADRADPAARVDPRVGPVARAAPAIRADLRVDRADRADPADLVTSIIRVVPVGRADPGARGTEIHNVVTSAGPRGVTGRRLGDPGSRPVPTGTGRSRRPVATGDMARSTTGDTRRLPSGIPDSISGGSGSSESGFRCRQR